MTHSLVIRASGLGFLSLVAITCAWACGSDQSSGQKGNAQTGGASNGGQGSGAGGDGGGGASSSNGGSSQGGGSNGGAGPTSGGTSGGGTAGGGSGGTTPGSGGSNTGTGGSTPIPVGCQAPVPAQNPGNACKNAAPPAVKLTPIVSGLASPVLVTQPPGEASRLFVVQHRGKIVTVKDGAVEATPFLDISSVVGGAGLAGEQGLLGVAFDPNYVKSGRFWVKYSATTGNGADTVAEYSGTPGQPASATTGKILAEVSANHPNFIGNHNGGMLAFGHDGCLYISYGDGGGAGDPTATGQNPGDLFGSILRIDVDHFPTPAPGNLGGSANPHVWDYGLRNPWRFSFDSATGDLYIGDVGQDAWEEVDVEAAQTGHKNYGWNTMEAKHCYNAVTCNQSGLTLPVTEYPNPPGAGQSAVVGGYVYRGSKIPGMAGRYVYADTYSMKLSSFTWSGEGTICDEYPLNVTAGGPISAFGQDNQGEIYVVTYDGSLSRLDPG